MAPLSTITFGDLLKQIRKRAGMTQSDLAAAVGYSVPFISNLELNQRLPDVSVVVERFVPALGLQADPPLAARLIEGAATARGERPPLSVTWQRTTHTTVQEEWSEQTAGLPALPTTLIGRHAEVKQLCQRLLGHQGRVLTLVGPPGVGKTTLALAVAAQLPLHYTDGIIFVPLAAINDETFMAATIAAAVGCSDANPKPPKVRLIEFLRRKTMLLVLDNLEQIAGAGGLIADLVAECPRLAILATSRERLHLRAEQRYKVPPLDLAAAVELFTQRAQAVDPDFRLTLGNRPLIETICERLDCLPLALELCAPHLELFSPAQLLAQLQASPLDLLVDGPQDLPPQHRTLRAAIQRSYALLTDAERRLLRGLGVFRGGFTLAAVEQVSQMEEATTANGLHAKLSALLGKSLVHVEKTALDEQRFLLLETIREFALEQVRLSGEEAGLRQRHWAAYLALFHASNRHLRGPEAALWFQKLNLEQDNVRAALQWALAGRHYEEAATLFTACFWFWFRRGHWREALTWGETILTQAPALPVPLHAELALSLAGLAGIQGQIQAAHQYHTEGLRLAQASGIPALIVIGLFNAGRGAFTRDEAIDLLTQAITLARQLENTDLLANLLFHYGDELRNLGRYPAAERAYRESLQLFRAAGNCDFIAYPLGGLGRLALISGDLTQAQNFFSEALDLALRLDSRMALTEWQPWLGMVHLYLGHQAEAQQLLAASLQLCHELGDQRNFPHIAGYLAAVRLHQGELAQAEQLLRQSLAGFAQARWVTAEIVDGLLIAAQVATAQANFFAAATLFGLAERLQAEIHHALDTPMRPLVSAALATVEAALDPAMYAKAFAMGKQMALAEASAAMLAPSAMVMA